MNNSSSTIHYPLSTIALSIAASDPTGGAGIQADLKVLQTFGVHGLSAITAITAQNTLGVRSVWPVPAESLQSQLNALREDIPFSIIKIGALGSREAVEVVVDFVAGGEYTVILDPVIQPTSGRELTSSDAVDMMVNRLFPHVTLLTPNILEAEVLLGRKIASFDEMEDAARSILALGPKSVLLKGGHVNSVDRVQDLFLDHEGATTFSSPRISGDLHGSGCMLSSAIAALLVHDADMLNAIEQAREFVHQVRASAMQIGGGDDRSSPRGQRIASPISFIPDFVA
ncbi:MAG: bifunctional hydroxymethylpyrimidine kinase/phosphomethylpyrimidine kinase [Bacteroidota bacterium]|nr:bifunctional hydroxymethylpyrimidine kinase/phosphomethylpyrimidine kinase [Bacteroidota bacterium]MDP4231829.1 bifunctional hydroxymethylpyrimidine kinase/phosphomethylpyrimidine kinase [Bacteroidota bacterium]MDP4242715.1 bifunctional hydroxymethylpyrimidine kinase/phosphomethylpyrimidine kinase [Bacteroidota bacterium]MDP4287166.1 bifunctional hydroxymethylpyrimidine kinase/phosphomethylpyrimidine kinase [Bacteroidota bacterium]